jgi:hypothetical protein
MLLSTLSGAITPPTKTKKPNRKTKNMGHGIYQPHDIVQSNQGTEWHTFAEHREFIGDKEVEKQLFDIIESPAFVVIDGEQTALDNYKVLVADHRKVRSDLSGSDALVPLHIPKAGYKVISNREIWNTMQSALRDLDCKVTSVCTLERGKKFAISADIGSSDLVINKDKFKANLNKRRFIGMLSDDEKRETMQSRGREAVRQAVLAN